MNCLNGHREYYPMDRIGVEQGRTAFTQANFDKRFVREIGLLLETDKDTRDCADRTALRAPQLPSKTRPPVGKVRKLGQFALPQKSRPPPTTIRAWPHFQPRPAGRITPHRRPQIRG